MEQPKDFENSLPFSETKQNAILGYLLINDNFFLQAFNRIKPQFFLSPYSQKIYETKEEFCKQYNRCPTIQEIKEYKTIALEEQNIRNKIYLVIDNCINETRNIGLDTIYPELTAWLHVRLYKKAVEQSTRLYNNKQPQQAFQIIKSFSREIDQIKFEREEEVIFSNFESFLDSCQVEYKDALTTGLESLDKLLLPEAQSGALLKGDTTIYMGPTNIGKCLGKGTLVLKFDGTLTPVENVKTGDLLMGPDSKPRKVLSTNKGIGPLYEVIPNAGGDSWICNDVHVLSLKAGWDEHGYKKEKIINISLNEYNNKSKNYKRIMKLWRTGVNFTEKGIALPIDPYIFGLWLGDGSSDCATLTSADDILAKEWTKWVKSNKDSITIRTRENNKAKMYSASKGDDKTTVNCNQLLRTLNVLNNKHVPFEYLTSSKENRLKLLAGIIDTDGYRGQSAIEIISVKKELADNYAFLARSLGFKVKINNKIGSIKKINFKGNYYRVTISGELSQIPTLLNRKQGPDSKKNPNTTGFKVKSLGQGEFYGFTLDKDHLFLLGDFTVTHNTSFLLTTIGHNIRKDKDVLFISHEGRQEDLTIKIWCTFLKRTKSQIFEMYKTKEGKAIMDLAVKMIDRRLTYIPFNKPGATVEEVMSIIRRKQDERIAKYGKGYDLVVDDYPAKLMLGTTSGVTYQLRNAEEIVYNNFVQAALEYNFHALLAIQTNREGSKVNKQMNGNTRLLVKEDVKETWGVTNIATNLITINRSPLAAMKEFVTFNVDKSRSNSTGWAVVCKTDMGKTITHSNELGCMWYKGVMTIDDRLEDLFLDYYNREIPQHLIV